jgi:CIC family chloride channel protein
MFPSFSRLWAAAPSPAAPPPDTLSDFTVDRRVLLLAAMSVVLGALSSGVALVLIWLINVVTNLAFHLRFSAEPAVSQGHLLGGWVVVVPVIGAVIIGLMARFGSDKIRGHGIPEALEAILLRQSRIQPKVAILKPISAAISIGTGGPFGAEGPIIMTGGAFGSIFAQRFHLTASERKTLLVAGAAGGMAAIFATPLAAVLLAVELMLFEWRPRSLIPVVVAAVAAAVFRVPLLGAGPVFPVIAHGALTGWEVLVAAAIGIVAGFGAGGLTALVYGMEDLFHKLPVHWMWWPAIGAVVVGLGGIVDPRVLGVGYETIHALLRGEMVGAVVVGLMVAKAVVWTTALGSGTSGGVLAPLLILGGSLGALLAGFLPIGDAGLWAMVGMAAMMGGTMRAPLAATVFAVELTHDFNALPATLIGCAASYCVMVLLMRRSILTEKLARRGQHIACEYAVDPFELIRVGDVMDPEVPSVPESTTVAELLARIEQHDPKLSSRQGTLVMDALGNLSGILTRSDLLRELRRDPAGTISVGEFARKDLVVAHPDEPLQVVLNKMLERNIGRVPVMDRNRPGQVVGYLGRAAILSARTRFHLEERVREKG